VEGAPTPIGREGELAHARAVLDAAASGPSALVLHGPAGIGKTTIWRALRDEATERGFLTMSTRAVETEAQLAFNGLVDLLDPWIDEVIDQLPAAQRAAMDVALQRAPVGEMAPPPLAVSMATLASLRARSVDSPLVIAIDDLPWLDRPSANVLEYAMRRVEGMPLAFVAAVRVTDPASLPMPAIVDAFAGPVTMLPVGPLDLNAVDGLIRLHLGLEFRRPVLARIERESGGNPFHALAIARRLEPGGAELEAEAEAPFSTSETLARKRIEALPPATRQALAAVAALGRPSMETLREAVPDLDAALSVALEHGVLEEGRVGLRFTHPLLREAAYDALEEEAQRRLHGTLAAATSDVEEHALHLALAITGLDPDVADELEEASDHALARGATDAAAELLLRAIGRTPDSDVETTDRRIVKAAELLIRAGDAHRARTVLEAYVEGLERGPRRAAILRWIADTRSTDDWGAKAEILEAALLEAGEDHGLRSHLLRELYHATWFAVGPVERLQVLADKAVAEAEAQDDPEIRCAAYLTEALHRSAAGYSHAKGWLDKAKAVAPADQRIIWSPAFCEALLLKQGGRFGAAVEILRGLRDHAEERGDWDTMPHILSDLAEGLARVGELQEAASIGHEGERGYRQNGQPLGISWALLAQARVALARGDETACRSYAEQGEAFAGSCGGRSNVLACQVVTGSLELSLGNAERAVARLEPIVRIRTEQGLGLAPLTPAAELAEALTLADRATEAEALLLPFTEQARHRDDPTELAACERVTGMLASSAGEEERAEAAFSAALEHHARVREPLEEARTWFALGQSRRRFRRRGQAAEALRRAIEIFETLGSRIWLDRARAELARTGHREAGARLSPTQEQIAELVAAGRTNREVAEALFMSSHTVEAHLTRIYRSLGIRGRTELARALASRGDIGGASEDEGVG
jgi:DNA-binding CsgD family transcriptional regulator